METEQLVQLRASMRRFIDEHIPRQLATEWDSSDTFDKQIVQHFADLGVMGITTPEQYGGIGSDVVAALVVIEELSKRSIAAASAYIMGACYGAMNIVESGSEEQKEHYLPLIANGQCLFAYGLSEPDVGADLATVQTKVRMDGDQLVINGSKRWCTGATIADNIFVLARTVESSEKYQNLSLLIVPTNSKGISINPLDVIGSRGVGTTDVVFDDVQIPVKNILGGESKWNQGWGSLAGSTLEIEKLEVAAMSLGVAEGALQDAWEYSQQRVQFGVPISAHQAIRHRLAAAKAKLFSARSTLYAAAEMASNGVSCGAETSMAKYMVSELAQEVVLACQRVMGAYGCVRGEGGDMDRYVRESLVFPIAGGSSDIQLNNIANRLRLAKA